MGGLLAEKLPQEVMESPLEAYLRSLRVAERVRAVTRRFVFLFIGDRGVRKKRRERYKGRMSREDTKKFPEWLVKDEAK